MERTGDEERDLIVASILLAEDSEDDRALAFRALRRCGIPVAVQVATDGQRALSLLAERNSGLPALVVLDVKMPRLSGIEVLGAIRDDARFDHVPVVMMTSSDEPTDIEVCRRLGADAYMRKPVDFEEYLGLVADVAQFWLTHPRGTADVPNSLLNSMAVQRA
jgi:two-component system response regulator